MQEEDMHSDDKNAGAPQVGVSSVKGLNGRWTLNKTLSSSVEPILELQGVLWILRKAIVHATITLRISQYTAKSSSGVEYTHVNIEQFVSPGNIAGTSERRTLSWAPKEHYDYIFGYVMGQSRFASPADIGTGEPGEHLSAEDFDFLKIGWDEELNGNILIETWAHSLSAAAWVVEQVWGFENVDGKRVQMRRIVARKGSQVVRGVFVYDYIGELEN